jgi:type II secretory pathway pseudopilin PulG
MSKGGFTPLEIKSSKANLRSPKGDLSLTGLTILELLTVIIIIGILSTLSISHYSGIKERALDNEARNNLILLQGAERVFRVENGNYYPDPVTGNIADIALINSNLGLMLSPAANRDWDYQVWSTGCSRATRNGGDGRSWYFAIGDADNKPDAGSGCP